MARDERITDFEDLVAWQKARELTRQAYTLTSTSQFARDLDLRSQMRRSSVSIMSNIAEGFERNTSAEFHQFLVIAKASCGELRSHLYVALDAGYIKQEVFERMRSSCMEISRIIGGLKSSIKKRKVFG